MFYFNKYLKETNKLNVIETNKKLEKKREVKKKKGPVWPSLSNRIELLTTFMKYLIPSI